MWCGSAHTSRRMSVRWRVFVRVCVDFRLGAPPRRRSQTPPLTQRRSIQLGLTCSYTRPHTRRCMRVCASPAPLTRSREKHAHLLVFRASFGCPALLRASDVPPSLLCPPGSALRRLSLALFLLLPCPSCGALVGPVPTPLASPPPSSPLVLFPPLTRRARVCVCAVCVCLHQARRCLVKSLCGGTRMCTDRRRSLKMSPHVCCDRRAAQPHHPHRLFLACLIRSFFSSSLVSCWFAARFRSVTFAAAVASPHVPLTAFDSLRSLAEVLVVRTVRENAKVMAGQHAGEGGCEGAPPTHT